MLTRRELIKMAAMAGAGTALYRVFGTGRAWAFAQSPTNIRKFITTLPGLGPAGANNIGRYIPLATKTTQTFAGLANRRLQARGETFWRTHAPQPFGRYPFLGLLRFGDR